MKSPPRYLLMVLAFGGRLDDDELLSGSGGCLRAGRNTPTGVGLAAPVLEEPALEAPAFEAAGLRGFCWGLGHESPG